MAIIVWLSRTVGGDVGIDIGMSDIGEGAGAGPAGTSITAEIDMKKLDTLLTPDFKSELVNIWSAIHGYKIRAAILRKKIYVVRPEVITPNLLPYPRTTHKTQIDLETAVDNSGDLTIQTQEFIDDELVKFIQDDKWDSHFDGVKTELIGSLQKGLMNTPIKGTKETKEKFRERIEKLVNSVGNIPPARVEEFKNKVNKYFEGTAKSERLRIEQTNRHRFQLYRSLIVNYMRFYISLFTNHTAVELTELATKIGDVKLFFDPALYTDEDTLKNLQLRLMEYQMTISNDKIDHLYIYSNKKYGNSALLINHPEQITMRLRKILGKAGAEEPRDTKCFESLPDNEQLTSDKVVPYLQFVLFDELQRLFDKRRGSSEIYARFVFDLLTLMDCATSTYFQPEADTQYLRYLQTNKYVFRKPDTSQFGRESNRVLPGRREEESAEVEVEAEAAAAEEAAATAASRGLTADEAHAANVDRYGPSAVDWSGEPDEVAPGIVPDDEFTNAADADD